LVISGAVCRPKKKIPMPIPVAARTPNRNLASEILIEITEESG